MFTLKDFRWGIPRSIVGFNPEEINLEVVDSKALAAEFLGTFIIVTVGCGCACSNGWDTTPPQLLVGFCFSMALMVLAYALGHHSGAHFNFAVTFSLFIGEKIHWAQMIGNGICQLLGSLFGATILCLVFPCETDLTGNLGSSVIRESYGDSGRAVVAEAFGTLMLCFAYWETATTPKSSCGKNACVAIGFASFVAHILLLPIDGCSISPMRSTGPAIVSQLRKCDNFTDGAFRDLWVMWVGPLVGAFIIGLCQNPYWMRLAKKYQMIE